MMKRVILILLFVFMLVPPATAQFTESGFGDSGSNSPGFWDNLLAIAGQGSSNCNSDLDLCKDASYTYGAATTYVKLEIDEAKCITILNQNGKNTCLTKDATVNYRCTADKAYILPSYNGLSCDGNGCTGSGIQSLPLSGEVTLGDEPKVVCWDRRDNDGWWAWSWIAWEFRQRYKQVECTQENECASSEICNSQYLCQPVECKQESDCSSLELCNNYQCKPVECKQTADCSSDFKICAQNQCQTVQCTVNQQCGLFEECAENICVTKERFGFIDSILNFFKGLFDFS